MSLKANIIASYLSQAYVSLLGIVVLPLYIRYMGVESYGLVGFFSLLQVWFSLLDMGMTPMLARETARFHGGSSDALAYRKLVRALEGIFLLAALAGGLLLFAASNYISRHWLQIAALDIRQVETSVQLMAAIIAIRWVSSLYRSTLSGAERLVWLGTFNSIMATVRFLGVIPILVWLNPSPEIFFLFQLGVAATEGICLWRYSRRLLPGLPVQQKLGWDWKPLKAVYRFSLGIAFASLVWILITQVDKLILSHLLPLEEYGYFTLAVLVAGSVTMISSPISTAIMPRMAKLEAEGKNAELIQLYRQTTQWIALIAGSTAVTLALSAKPLLLAWTNNPDIAEHAASILVLYSIGNGIMALSAFPYYLQYAKGDLHLHLTGNVVFVVLLVPMTIWASQQFGAQGAGYAWLIINLLTFLLWLPYVHHRLIPGLNRHWYGNDVLIILLATTMTGYIVNSLLPTSSERWIQLTDILIVGLSAFLAGAAASSDLRIHLMTRYNKYNETTPNLRLHRHL